MSDETAGAPGDQKPDPQPGVSPTGEPEPAAQAQPPQSVESPYAGPQYHQPQYGAAQAGASQPAQQETSGYPTPYGAPQQGEPQYGEPQYGAPQYGAPQYGAPQYGAAPYGSPAPSSPGSGLAVTALVLGILALLSSWVPFVNIGSILLGLAGLALGIVALSKVRRGTGGGKGMALGGAITSVLAILVSIVVLVAFFLFLRSASESVTDALDEVERQANGEAEQVDPADVLALGEPVELDSYTVTVTNITPSADDILAQDDYNPSPDYQYALVDLSVTYTGTTDPTDTGTAWLDLDVELAGADGLAYSSSDCTASPPKNALDLEDLSAGDSADFQVCLDAPVEALTGGTVVVGELFSFSSEGKGYWAVP